jgi:hypothetical protein
MSLKATRRGFDHSLTEANRGEGRAQFLYQNPPFGLFFAVDSDKIETDQHMSDHPYPQTEASASLRSPQTEAPAT